jgi:hydrogenase expression/formation protein HypC
MCLGLPAKVVSTATGHPDLVAVEMAGVPRTINIGLLTDGPAPLVGDWLLCHMGFALSIISEQEAHDALHALGEERRAVAALYQNP